MAFTEIQKQAPVVGGRKPSLRIAIRRGGANKVVGLSKMLIEKLGWARATRVSIAVGSGPDAGWVRVSPTHAGGYKASIGKSGHGSIVMNQVLRGLTLSKPVDCQFLVKGDTLLFRLPAGLASAEQPAINPGLSATTLNYANGTLSA